MPKKPWLKLWVARWLGDPHLTASGFAARGLLADLMCIAHHGEPEGYVTNGGVRVTVKDIAKSRGERVSTVKKLVKILKKSNRLGETESGTFFIPSVVRDAEEVQRAVEFGRLGGNPHLTKRDKGPVKGGDKGRVNLEVEEEVEKEEEREKNHLPRQILDYLNQKLDTKYRCNGKITERILSLVKQGYGKADFEKVIDGRIKVWRHDKKMAQHLRPKTIFGENFEEYLNAVEPQEKEEKTKYTCPFCKFGTTPTGKKCEVCQKGFVYMTSDEYRTLRTRQMREEARKGGA